MKSILTEKNLEGDLYKIKDPSKADEKDKKKIAQFYLKNYKNIIKLCPEQL